MSDPTATGVPPWADWTGVIVRDHSDTLIYFNGDLVAYQARNGAPWVPFEGPSVMEWLKATGVEMYG